MKATGRVARLEAWLQDARLAALHDLTAADLRALLAGVEAVEAGSMPSEAQQAACDKWMHYVGEQMRVRTLGKHYTPRPWQDAQPPAQPQPPAPSPPRYAPEAYAPPAVPGTEAQPEPEPEAPAWNFQTARRQFQREMAAEERRKRRQEQWQPEAEYRTRRGRLRIYRL